LARLDQLFFGVACVEPIGHVAFVGKIGQVDDRDLLGEGAQRLGAGLGIGATFLVVVL
jgi:hypothetical protein